MTKSIIIRTMRHGDLDQVMKLYGYYLREFGETTNMSSIKKLVDFLLRSRWIKVKLAVEKGEIIGFVTFIPSYSSVSTCPSIDIIDFFIEKNKRRQGVGTRLLQEIENYARANGIGKIFVNIRLDKQGIVNFYQSYGWKKLGLPYSQKLFKSRELGSIIKK